jgi:hypothetical protein
MTQEERTIWRRICDYAAGKNRGNTPEGKLSQDLNLLNSSIDKTLERIPKMRKELTDKKIQYLRVTKCLEEVNELEQSVDRKYDEVMQYLGGIADLSRNDLEKIIGEFGDEKKNFLEDLDDADCRLYASEMLTVTQASLSDTDLETAIYARKLKEKQRQLENDINDLQIKIAEYSEKALNGQDQISSLQSFEEIKEKERQSNEESELRYLH